VVDAAIVCGVLLAFQIKGANFYLLAAAFSAYLGFWVDGLPDILTKILPGSK
jgi:hypothetical protein